MSPRFQGAGSRPPTRRLAGCRSGGAAPDTAKFQRTGTCFATMAPIDRQYRTKALGLTFEDNCGGGAVWKFAGADAALQCFKSRDVALQGLAELGGRGCSGPEEVE